MITLKWFKTRWKEYIIRLVLMVSFNLYFIFLMHAAQTVYLMYLDILLMIYMAIADGTDFYKFSKTQRRKLMFLQKEEPVYEALGKPSDDAVYTHDMQIMERRIQEKFAENCELQDYVAKWCHEFKIPLTAAFMITEKVRNADLRIDLKEQLERMNLQLSMMLQGCRLQSPLFDLQIRQVSLEKCIRSSIKNNQFFLIQKKFRIDVEVEDVTVYTDEVWLTYILDQILNNAIKYSRPDAEHHIRFWTTPFRAEVSEAEVLKTEPLKTDDQRVKLFVEDNGDGIKECDIRRIFEKGYTGSNYHNGKYKSTGMGLYMADKIAKRLEHDLSVESVYGKYTRFCIVFVR